MRIEELAAMLLREGTEVKISAADPSHATVVPRRLVAVRIRRGRLAQLADLGAVRIDGDSVQIDAARCAQISAVACNCPCSACKPIWSGPIGRACGAMGRGCCATLWTSGCPAARRW